MGMDRATGREVRVVVMREDRAIVLSRTTLAFARAVSDERGLSVIIATQIATALGCRCIVGLTEQAEPPAAPETHPEPADIVLALRGDEETVGHLRLSRVDGAPPFDEHDMAFAQLLADHAAVAIINARLLARPRGDSLTSETVGADGKNAEQEGADLAAIVNASADAIIGKSVAGVITSWNPGAERLFGYRADEAVGESIMLIVPSGRADEERSILATLSRGGTRHFDTVRLRKDGSEVEVAVTAAPVFGAAGQIVGISKVARDITDRKRAERELARARDAAEAASSELESFAYSVAHDLRAPLRAMNGFAQLLLESYGDRIDTEGHDWLNEILNNAKRMADLIDGLLTLSRVARNELDTMSVDLSAIVRSIGARLSADEPQRIVELLVEEHVRVNCDPRLARALLDNLVRNAWKFTSRVPRARIEFASNESPGGRVFYVRDNGAGFDMTYAAKLFTPFQRLHSGSEFPGTGIGLATAQRIVRRHGGKIWAEGVVNGGATFHFSIADGPTPETR